MKVVVLTAAMLLPTSSDGVPVDVMVSNIRNDKGHVLAALCTQTEFLSMHCAYVGNAPARVGSVRLQINGVRSGTYAIEVYHDENDNKKIDRNFFGIPTEGLGFSNDARFRFGPPTFADAQVTIGSQGASLMIRMRYF